MSNQTTTITIPQYSTRSLSYTIATTPTYFTNLTDLTRDPTFGTLFGVSSSSSVFLTTNEPPVTTAGTRFLLLDSTGSNSFIDLRVNPVSFSVSSSIVLLQGLSRGLPFTLTPPSSNINGTIQSTFTAGVSSNFDFPCSVLGSRFNSANGFISPMIAPLGLTSNINASTGIVTVNGIPTIPRPASNYTYFAFDPSGRQMRTDFSIQVTKATFEYTSNQGAISIAGSNAVVTLSYGVANDIRFTVDPTPISFTTTGSFPVDISRSGNLFTLSGTPTSFLDIPGGVQGVVRPSFSNIGPPLTITFSMNPVLLFQPTPSLTFFCNVPYTADYPIARYSAQYFPSYTNPTYQWSLSTSIADLTLDSAGRLYGTIGNISNVADITVSSGGLTKTTQLTLSAIPDVVTVSGPLSYSAIQNTQIFNLSFRATCSSANVVPPTFSYFSSPPFSTFGTPLLPDGSVGGTPRTTVSEQAIVVTAVNLQGISGSHTISFAILPDVITISSTGLGGTTPSSPLTVIQGRDVTLDIPEVTRSYFATVSSGNAPIYISDVSGGLALSRDGILSGTPLFSGDRAFSISATVVFANTFSADTLYIRAISDQVILDTPSSTDFVLALGSTSNIQLQGALFSGSTISSYSLSGNAGGAVSITSAGLLTLSSTTVQEATPFAIVATAADSGVQSLIPSTLTINNPALGSFVTPAIPTTLYFPTNGDSFAIQTSTLYSLTLSGGTGFTLVGSNLVRTISTEVYTPVPAVLQATTGLAMPVRLATRALQLQPLGPYNWIEYARIDPIQVQTFPWNLSALFAVPFIPPGLTWNPIAGTLTGSARELTIGDFFRVYATDGNVSTFLDVPYTTRAPAYLRGFSSPSAYTNYVRQRAIVNSAYHAIDRTAVLPDQLIASQTGEYPSDISKDVICHK